MQYSIVCIALSGLLPTAQAASSSEQKKATDDKLSDVQQAIKEKQSTINKTVKDRSALEKQLKLDDVAIGKSAKAINQTTTELTEVQQKITELEQSKNVLIKQKKRQEQLLAQQLRTAYSSGHHDYLKLILNQEDPAKVQRTLTHFNYLNDARIKEIEQFQETLSELLLVTTEHEEKVASLKQLQQQQTQQKLALENNKKARASTIAALNETLLTSKQQLSQLQKEEDNLVAALKRLAALSRPPANLSGLSKLKKKLRWPVKGNIVRSYGSQKQGYLTWKGVLMTAPLGRQVTTIHDGKILFADWLKGYGLVTVIDHGDGYMSLYGHNQTLLKNVGDRVEEGEPIALIGQSGGQNRPALYFEIRHKGKAVNPKFWCKR